MSGIFADGIGAAAATSGVLTQLQGRIFGLLYLHEGPLSLDDISDQLQQSKSNVSVQVRGLLDWQLVKQVRVAGSRRDHYEAATDLWRVMQTVVERRFRWNLRQVLATVDEAEHALPATKRRAADDTVRERLQSLRAYFRGVDALLSALSQGQPLTADQMQDAVAQMPRTAAGPR